MTAAAYSVRQSSSREGVTQSISFGASSTPIGNAFGPTTYQIRLACTQNCYYQIGDGVQTAVVTTSPFLPNTWTEYVSCSPGQRIAAIQQGASAGVLTVTEIA